MMPVTTISATPLSANGTVETGWIYIADGLYNNVGVIAGADTSGAINILFSNDGSTTLCLRMSRLAMSGHYTFPISAIPFLCHCFPHS